MARPNYSIAEKKFTRNAILFHRDKLIKLVRNLPLDAPPEVLPSVRTRKDATKKLKKTFQYLQKVDSTLLKDLDLSLEEIDKWHKNHEKLSLEEWQRIHVIRIKLLTLRSAMHSEMKKISSENTEQIEGARIDHLNLRHKIKHGWWPV